MSDKISGLFQVSRIILGLIWNYYSFLHIPSFHRLGPSLLSFKAFKMQWSPLPQALKASLVQINFITTTVKHKVLLPFPWQKFPGILIACRNMVKWNETETCYLIFENTWVMSIFEISNFPSLGKVWFCDLKYHSLIVEPVLNSNAYYFFLYIYFRVNHNIPQNRSNLWHSS